MTTEVSLLKFKESVDSCLTLLEAIRPHIDSIVCYASTISEYPPNALPASLEQEIANLKQLQKTLEAPTVRFKERWNIEEDGDDLLVCFNHHEKGEKCEYRRYVLKQT